MSCRLFIPPLRRQTFWALLISTCPIIQNCCGMRDQHTEHAPSNGFWSLINWYNRYSHATDAYLEYVTMYTRWYKNFLEWWDHDRYCKWGSVLHTDTSTSARTNKCGAETIKTDHCKGERKLTLAPSYNPSSVRRLRHLGVSSSNI